MLTSNDRVTRKKFRDALRHGNEALSKNFPFAGFSSAFYFEFTRWPQRRPMIPSVRKFWADDTGATAIEYRSIAAGISLAIRAVVNGAGARLDAGFAPLDGSLK
jgi:pilus assembly protein Flp/PilA